MDDATQHQAPVKLDIFTDGSWLKEPARKRSDKNCKPAGGWAAIVIETYADGSQQKWSCSGKSSENVKNNDDAEMEAVREAFAAIKAKQKDTAQSQIPFTLHTDQQFWENQQSALRKNPNHSPSEENKQFDDLGTEIKMHELVKDIISMRGTIKYTTHNKDYAYRRNDPRPSDDFNMNEVDALAKHQAWVQRFEKQGHIVLKKRKTRPNEGEPPEDFIKRIFDLGIDLDVPEKKPFQR